MFNLNNQITLNSDQQKLLAVLDLSDEEFFYNPEVHQYQYTANFEINTLFALLFSKVNGSSSTFLLHLIYCNGPAWTLESDNRLKRLISLFINLSNDKSKHQKIFDGLSYEINRVTGESLLEYLAGKFGGLFSSEYVDVNKELAFLLNKLASESDNIPIILTQLIFGDRKLSLSQLDHSLLDGSSRLLPILNSSYIGIIFPRYVIKEFQLFARLTDLILTVVDKNDQNVKKSLARDIIQLFLYVPLNTVSIFHKCYNYGDDHAFYAIPRLINLLNQMVKYAELDPNKKQDKALLIQLAKLNVTGAIVVLNAPESINLEKLIEFGQHHNLKVVQDDDRYWYWHTYRKNIHQSYIESLVCAYGAFKIKPNENKNPLIAFFTLLLSFWENYKFRKNRKLIVTTLSQCPQETVVKIIDETCHVSRKIEFSEASELLNSLALVNSKSAQSHRFHFVSGNIYFDNPARINDLKLAISAFNEYEKINVGSKLDLTIEELKILSEHYMMLSTQFLVAKDREKAHACLEKAKQYNEIYKKESKGEVDEMFEKQLKDAEKELEEAFPKKPAATPPPKNYQPTVIGRMNLSQTESPAGSPIKIRIPAYSPRLDSP